MNPPIKKTLAVFSLTSCEGCQFEMLSFYDHFKQLLNFYDIHNFRLGQEDNLPGPFDVALVEGNPDGQRQIKFLRDIRKNTKTIVAMGACAQLGGIQSQRNSQPKKLIGKANTQTVFDIIKVDFTVPGCPVSHRELFKCLLDIYWDKPATLPDLGVCFECRQNENECHLKNGRPCLGPITIGGCNSVCINAGEACLGCRGPLEQANFPKMKEILGAMIDENQIKDMLTFYGDYELEHSKIKSQNAK